MKCKTSRLTKDHSMNYWEMCKKKKKKTSLSSTHEKILHIIKEESKLGEKQRHQMILNILDILNNSHSEREIVEKITKEFPEHKQ